MGRLAQALALSAAALLFTGAMTNVGQTRNVASDLPVGRSAESNAYEAGSGALGSSTFAQLFACAPRGVSGVTFGSESEKLIIYYFGPAQGFMAFYLEAYDTVLALANAELDLEIANANLDPVARGQMGPRPKVRGNPGAGASEWPGVIQPSRTQLAIIEGCSIDKLVPDGDHRGNR